MTQQNNCICFEQDEHPADGCPIHDEIRKVKYIKAEDDIDW